MKDMAMQSVAYTHLFHHLAADQSPLIATYAAAPSHNPLHMHDNQASASHDVHLMLGQHDTV